MGGALSGIFVMTDDNNASGAGGTMGNEWYTLGARQKGKAGGLDYRVEYYHQFGDACGDACGTYAYTTETNDSSVDRDAYMFGVRVGKSWKNAQYSPTITLWYDYLSGTDDGDVVLVIMQPSIPFRTQAISFMVSWIITLREMEERKID